MRRWLVMAVLLGLAAGGHAAPFERYLSGDQPADRAIMAYMELEKSGKATSMDLTEMAVLLVNKGFPNDALDALKAALDKDKHNHEAAYRMGLILQRQGHYFRACYWYRRTLKERPGYGPARFMLALAQERQGRRYASIRNYKRAYRHAPDLADPAKNPLVQVSRLQTEALIESYREKVGKATHHVLPVDAAAVQRMMLTVPSPAVEKPPEAALPAPASAAIKPPTGKTTQNVPVAKPVSPSGSEVPSAKAIPAPRQQPAPASTSVAKGSQGLHAVPVVVPPVPNVSGAP